MNDHDFLEELLQQASAAHRDAAPPAQPAFRAPDTLPDAELSPAEAAPHEPEPDDPPADAAPEPVFVPDAPATEAEPASDEAVFEPEFVPFASAPHPSAPEPEAAPEPRRLGWLWFLLGLLLGLALGWLAARYLPPLFARSGEERLAATEEEESLREHLEIADDPAIATLPAAVYEQNVSAVVGITSEGTTTNIWGQQTNSAATGTGFLLTEDGYILTNYHVVKGARSLTVTLYDGRSFSAELIGYEAGTCDAALLKIDAAGLPTVTLGNSDNVIVGEQVCAIGNPLGELTYTLTVGYVSAKDRTVTTDGTPLNMLQTDCTINAGNSGGPLFDMNGNVIGITTAKYSGSTLSGASVEGIGFAIPINDVSGILDDLKTHGRIVGRAYLGVVVLTELPEDGLPAGVYVNSVTRGWCAYEAGMRAGDVITAIDGSSIENYDGLAAVLDACKPGQTVTIRVWRNGTSLDLEVTLDERPPET